MTPNILRKLAFAMTASGVVVSAQAEPVNYAIDPLHTAVRFGYDHLGWTYQQHGFDTLTGRVMLDRTARTAAVEVSIDARSVNTGSAIFNGQIQAEDLFDTARYPAITFKSNSVKFEGDRLVSIAGDLTIKGITKPVTLSVTRFNAGPHPIQKKRESIGADAVAKVKRSDFNLLKQLPMVADDIDLSFTLQAFKE